MKIFTSFCLETCPNALAFYESIRPKKSLFLYSGNNRGRYSWIMMQPKKYTVGIINIETMQKWFEESKKEKKFSSSANHKMPFAGGIGCILPYEKESIGMMGIFDHWFVEDHLNKKCFLQGWFKNEKEAKKWFSEFENKKFSMPYFKPVTLDTPFVSDWNLKEYLHHFKNCQKELETGNSFQINLSQKFTTTTPSSSWDIFCQATQKNPASMMAFWEDEEKAIISCSPERLFSIDATGKLLTQPIAGTRKRGNSLKEDEDLEKELKNSQKELSEHAMLVDLLRNDFGKVSQFGSVQVPTFGRVEKYASVMHLVSDVVGILAKNKTNFDVLKATFPGGTITGAPKQETMEILQREEGEKRGIYCGSVCYFSYTGNADASICIRTLEKNGEKIWGCAGGGIVWQADGAKEYEESKNKFKGLENIFT